ncbi:MAG: hypothetical protein FK733_01245 [Asgard group archaeon]|nr:hypothetical protein [Asgard group archaeon]
MNKINEMKNCVSIISDICLINNSEEVSVRVNYELLPKISYYNSIRMKIIDLLEEEFIQPVIERGIQKEHQRLLLQNNRSEFRQFIERKLRYWLNELCQSIELESTIENYNQELLLEIESNSKKINVTAEESEQYQLINIINNHITSANQSLLPNKISSFLLSKNKYKEMILGFFNEFLKYLIVF